MIAAVATKTKKPGKKEYRPTPEEIARVAAEIRREKAMKQKLPKKKVQFGSRKEYRNPFPSIASSGTF